MTPRQIFIGYDPREHEAYEVCEHSILRHARVPVKIRRVDMQGLRTSGLYDRPYRVDATGQMWDERDGRPFSTLFAFTRFLVPHIAEPGPALFVDCDFVFLQDVSNLFALFDPTKAVQVVKHNHNPTSPLKMDGMAQSGYNRKNWSSCMLFNVGHVGLAGLTAEAVNTLPGRDLHAFTWVDDDMIGELPEGWNWLADASPTTPGGRLSDIAAVHYTSGGPWFAHMRGCDRARDWFDARNHLWRQRVIV